MYLLLQEEQPKEITLLNGVHYGLRGYYGTFPGIKKIDQVSIDTPILVRTDIPHSVTYETTSGIRCGISIRFKESIEQWDKFSAKFLPIMKFE